jgi:hypothetical protein
MPDQPKRQKKITQLFRNLAIVCRSDGQFAEEEKKLLVSVAKLFGMPGELAVQTVREAKGAELDMTEFVQKQDIGCLLRFVMFVALADSKITPQEMKYIRTLTAKAGIGKDVFEAMWHACKSDVAETLKALASASRVTVKELRENGGKLIGKPVALRVEIVPFAPSKHEQGGYMFNGEDASSPAGCGIFVRVKEGSSFAALFMNIFERTPVELVGRVEPEVYGKPVVNLLTAKIEAQKKGIARK